MILIFLIIMKILSFGIPANLYNLAQEQNGVIQKMASQQEIERTFSIQDPNTNQTILKVMVSFPNTWRPAEERDVEYTVIAWNQQTPDILVTLTTVPELSGLNAPVRFTWQGDRTVTQIITYVPGNPSVMQGNVDIKGQLRVDGFNEITTSDGVTLINLKQFSSYKIAYIVNMALLVFTSILWILFTLFIW